MALLTNPVLVSVIVLCVLCLLKLNVLMSLIIAAMVGAMLGGISIPDAMGILCDGFSGNANTALSYVLLGTFATAIAANTRVSGTVSCGDQLAGAVRLPIDGQGVAAFHLNAVVGG